MSDQGIRITFLANPLEGDSIYAIGKIDGINITYNNALDEIRLSFTYSDALIASDPLHKVKIGANEQETANNLKVFFETKGYTSASVSVIYSVQLGSPVAIYSVQGLFIANKNIYWDIGASNYDTVIIGSFNENPVPTTAAKYIFQYKNIANDSYRCEIYQKNFTGQTREIVGRATITKSEVKNHFEPIRGTGLNLELEATLQNDFEDLYSGGETDHTVRLYYNNNVLIYQGILKPDGIYQSFVSDVWMINIECVDGLGFLSDLSFVNDNGVPFSGKMKAIDIIYYCLKRTGIQMNINTYIDVYFYGIINEDENTDVLREMYLDANRFVKSDDGTIMSCLEVLTSILKLFNAVITQEVGQWFIYRPSAFQYEKQPFFKSYDINNISTGTFKVGLDRSIGSQIDNFYPHHCNSNQRIDIVGAISAYRLNYKYGFIGSILENSTFKHIAGTNIYDNWTLRNWPQSKNSGYLVIDPASTNGIKFKSAVADIGETRNRQDAITSEETEELPEGYTLEFNTSFISYGFPVSIEFYVYLYPSDGSASYTLNVDGTWSSPNNYTMIFRSSDTSPNNTGQLVDENYQRSFSVKSNPLPKNGTVQIGMYVPFKAFGSPAVLVEVKSMGIVNTFSGNNVVGEFHTVSRINPVSSIAKNNDTIYNGDNVNRVYQGAIYMADQETLTSLWHRGQFPNEISAEAKPILRISAEDELRIAQKPLRMFSGDLYGGGFRFYMGVYDINKLTGKYMPVSYTFDTYNNITNMKMLEFYSPELYDIEYSKTDDYGETIKPTIIG